MRKNFQVFILSFFLVTVCSSVFADSAAKASVTKDLVEKDALTLFSYLQNAALNKHAADSNDYILYRIDCYQEDKKCMYVGYGMDADFHVDYPAFVDFLSHLGAQWHLQKGQYGLLDFHTMQITHVACSKGPWHDSVPYCFVDSPN